MKIHLNDSSKLETTSVPASGKASANPDEMLEAIVKLKKPNSAPKYVRVRAKISPLILTCSFPAVQLANLEKDPNVESVSLNQTLHSPK